MIRIREKQRDGRIVEIVVRGHAGAADKGEDLVCAGVSSIVFGLCNALDELSDSCDFEIQNNLIRISLRKPDETAELILKAGMIQLRTVEENQKEFIVIETEE